MPTPRSGPGKRPSSGNVKGRAFGTSKTWPSGSGRSRAASSANSAGAGKGKPTTSGKNRPAGTGKAQPTGASKSKVAAGSAKTRQLNKNESRTTQIVSADLTKTAGSTADTKQPASTAVTPENKTALLSAGKVPKSTAGKGPPSTPFQKLREQIKWVDLVFEVVDARAPASSRHPNSDEIFGSKPRLLVVTKEDLADRRVLEPWMEKGVILSLKSTKGKERIFKQALELTKAKRASLSKKGILPRPMRICVVGMPNVGKSSLINWLIGTKKAKVADRPGVTKGNQWVRVHPQLELLDTPGILPVSALNRETIIRLALFNLVPASNYEVEEVARTGLEILKSHYPQLLALYVPGADIPNLTLESLAEKKHFVTTGAKPDHMRAAQTLLSDLRAGKIGRVSLV